MVYDDAWSADFKRANIGKKFKVIKRGLYYEIGDIAELYDLIPKAYGLGAYFKCNNRIVIIRANCLELIIDKTH